MRLLTTEAGEYIVDLAAIKQESNTAMPFIQQNLKPLMQIADWVENVLSCPHPDLGRKGPVCPYVGKSLEQHFFWLAAFQAEHATSEEICATMLRYQDWYRKMQPDEYAEDAQYKTLLVLFPYLRDSVLLERVQRVLEADFLAKKLLIGHFYPQSKQPGLWSATFRPMVAPIPLLAMRHSVPMDHVNAATISRVLLEFVQ